MKINIKVHPKAKKNQVVKKAENLYEVWVTEPPDRGKANEAVCEALCEHWRIAKSRVVLVRGHTSKLKVVEVDFRQ